MATMTIRPLLWSSCLALTVGCDSKGDQPAPEQREVKLATVSLGSAGEPCAGLVVDVPDVLGSPQLLPNYGGAAMLQFNGFSVSATPGEIDQRFKQQDKRVTVDKDEAAGYEFTIAPRQDNEAVQYGYFVRKEVNGKPFVCGTSRASDFGLTHTKQVCASLRAKG